MIGVHARQVAYCIAYHEFDHADNTPAGNEKKSVVGKNIRNDMSRIKNVGYNLLYLTSASCYV